MGFHRGEDLVCLTPCSLIGGYQHFQGSYCLHIPVFPEAENSRFLQDVVSHLRDFYSVVGGSRIVRNTGNYDLALCCTPEDNNLKMNLFDFIYISCPCILEV
jgi:hypothetical protein